MNFITECYSKLEYSEMKLPLGYDFSQKTDFA